MRTKCASCKTTDSAKHSQLCTFCKFDCPDWVFSLDKENNVLTRIPYGEYGGSVMNSHDRAGKPAYTTEGKD